MVSANGVTGSVANPTTTPAITLDVSGAITTAVTTGARWEPVTNGDVDDPEIVFAAGDVVMALQED